MFGSCMALSSLSPVIETCHCRGRELVSDSISAIEVPVLLWLGLCTHYIDDLLPYEPLPATGMWSSFFHYREFIFLTIMHCIQLITVHVCPLTCRDEVKLNVAIHKKTEALLQVLCDWVEWRLLHKYSNSFVWKYVWYCNTILDSMETWVYIVLWVLRNHHIFLTILLFIMCTIKIDNIILTNKFPQSIRYQDNIASIQFCEYSMQRFKD